MEEFGVNPNGGNNLTLGFAGGRRFESSSRYLNEEPRPFGPRFFLFGLISCRSSEYNPYGFAGGVIGVVGFAGGVIGVVGFAGGVVGVVGFAGGVIGVVGFAGGVVGVVGFAGGVVGVVGFAGGVIGVVGFTGGVVGLYGGRCSWVIFFTSLSLNLNRTNN
jgi:hypothetical protein